MRDLEYGIQMVYRSVDDLVGILRWMEELRRRGVEKRTRREEERREEELRYYIFGNSSFLVLFFP